MCKFYQGAEDKALEMRMKQLFQKVHREKPAASRSVSSCIESCTWIKQSDLLNRSPRKHILLLSGDQQMSTETRSLRAAEGHQKGSEPESLQKCST